MCLSPEQKYVTFANVNLVSNMALGDVMCLFFLFYIGFLIPDVPLSRYSYLSRDVDL